MPSIKLVKRAELELFDACDWYEKQQKGLSLRLRKEPRATLALIESNPNLYAQRYSTDFHFAPLDKFPFIIVYWFDKGLNIVFIASIFHSKRNPDGFDL